MNISDTVIGALIGAAATAGGWLIDSLRRRSDTREKQREVIKQIFKACSTRAVYGLTHAQTNLDSMFAALTACRMALQGYVALIEDARQQQIVADIIGVLDHVERLQPKIRQTETPNQIDTAKRKILGLLKQLSDESGLHYTVPRNLIETNFFSMAEAIEPPPDNTSEVA
jgi:hypothetical protein